MKPILFSESTFAESGTKAWWEIEIGMPLDSYSVGPRTEKSPFRDFKNTQTECKKKVYENLQLFKKAVFPGNSGQDSQGPFQFLHFGSALKGQFMVHPKFGKFSFHQAK
jgi:hypothetical protein